MSTPLLSIGIIFKNDIRCIERCLKSLEPLRKAVPSELIMADTGSTDGSRAVAEQYADQVFDFPWINDFAAARNAVLDRCTGEWCFTVDSDEWLDSNCQALVRFLKSKQQSKYDFGSVIQRNYQDKQLHTYGDFYAQRLGRRSDGDLRYRGPIHEYLTYPDREPRGYMAFSDVILNHDGYIEVEPGHIQEKQRRNMELLRVELEKRPEDLRTLGQCIDSAETRKEKREYADCAMKILGKTQGEIMISSVIAYQKCMQVYYDDQEMDRVMECYQEWKNYCPESALLRMDGEALAAAAAYRKRKYEEALEHLERRSQALAEQASGADLRRSDRLYSQYNTDNRRWNSNLEAIRFQSLCTLERFQEADQMLEQIQLKELLVGDLQSIIRKALSEQEHLSGVEVFLRRCWDFYWDDAQWTDAEENAERKKAQSELVGMLQNNLKPDSKTEWKLLAKMGDRGPGRSARICLTDDPSQITKEWKTVNDWQGMLPQAYRHTMDLRLPLPAGFYRQNAEQLAGLTTALAGQPGFARMVLDWLTHTAPAEISGELTWQLDLVTAALRTPKWSEDVPVGEGLCALYLELSSTYLDNVYNPELLNESDIVILPGMHRYAWHYRQAIAALEQGDELGYVRSLRAGLDTAPAMKEMVDFLLDHKPKTAAQKELEQLAQQVRRILAQYAPDHPAVVALKASPAYQKVADLLEQDTVPAHPVEVPVSPQPLEEALAGNRQEIETSIRENIDRWGSDAAKKRVDDWEKYPLWGKNKEEVVANLTTALCDHGADFRWLFDRLGDEQSRRILTAVVRSWRFFDVLDLQQVKDTTYDDYFDLELLHCDDNEVVADLGAYTGDTFLSYVKNYGSMDYRRYYCYEITKDSVEQLKKATADYPRVVVRHKGVGSTPGTMTLDANADSASVNMLSDSEQAEQDETVEIVTLDQDIAEPLTLIKMDIEGSEQSAMQGCVRHIQEDRPKMALSVYHNFEDLWKLPQMIENLVHGYRFYLRYHGGNFWPSEIMLLALPPEN